MIARVRAAYGRMLDRRHGPVLNLPDGTPVFYDDDTHVGWGHTRARSEDGRSVLVKPMRAGTRPIWIKTRDIYSHRRLLSDPELLADLRPGDGIVVRSRLDTWTDFGRVLSVEKKRERIHINYYQPLLGAAGLVVVTKASRIYLATKEPA